MKNSFLFFLLIALFFHSCTIEKRRYTDGYHVEWHHKGKDVRISDTDTERDLAVLTENPVFMKEDFQITRHNSADLNPTASDLNEQRATEVIEVMAQTVRIPQGKSKVASSHQVMEKLLSNTLIRHQYANHGRVSYEVVHEHRSDTDTLLLIFIAIFVSPLAVFLHEGRWNSKCWINLILWLLFLFPGFIHALIVILG